MLHLVKNVYTLLIFPARNQYFLWTMSPRPREKNSLQNPLILLSVQVKVYNQDLLQDKIEGTLGIQKEIGRLAMIAL